MDNDVMKPPMGLLCKLGSIVVHADELTSPDGHEFDREALKSLLGDHEVVSWLKGMRGMALIPEKRRG